MRPVKKNYMTFLRTHMNFVAMGLVVQLPSLTVRQTRLAVRINGSLYRKLLPRVYGKIFKISLRSNWRSLKLARAHAVLGVSPLCQSPYFLLRCQSPQPELRQELQMEYRS